MSGPAWVRVTLRRPEKEVASRSINAQLAREIQQAPTGELEKLAIASFRLVLNIEPSSNGLIHGISPRKPIGYWLLAGTRRSFCKYFLQLVHYLGNQFLLLVFQVRGFENSIQLHHRI